MAIGGHPGSAILSSAMAGIAGLSPDEGGRTAGPRGYRRRASYYGKPAPAVEDQLEQNFDVEASIQVWVRNITYIRTDEG